MHKPEPVLENESHKILGDFEIQSDHSTSVRSPGLVIMNNKEEKRKRTCLIVNFAVPAIYGQKIEESEKRDKYLDLARELKELGNMRVTVIPIVIGVLVTVREARKKVRRVGNRKMSRDNPNYNIAEINQNTEESPVDLRKLIVIQTPEKDNQLMLV